MKTRTFTPGEKNKLSAHGFRRRHGLMFSIDHRVMVKIEGDCYFAARRVRGGFLLGHKNMGESRTYHRKFTDIMSMLKYCDITIKLDALFTKKTIGQSLTALMVHDANRGWVG